MERVVTINLNGIAYQLDETAFAALRAYLDQADARLRNNPDRTEILTDLEQAIGEKCGRFLGPHKTVVTKAEIDQILNEMGPVQADGDAAPAAASAPKESESQSSERPGPKRLYRIRKGAIFMGVCNGLGAYLNMDAVFVRVAFVVAVIVTFGWAWLGYWVLAFIIPEARTADEHAAAHGQAPFNAQDVVDEARRAADSFKTHAENTSRAWRRQAREQRRQWRSQARAWRESWYAGGWGAPPAAPGLSTAPPMAMAALPIFGLINFVAFFAVVAGVVSLLGTGSLWGWPLPHGMPIWAGILILVVVFHLFSLPIRAARRAYRHGWGWQSAWLSMWDSAIGTVVVAFGIWLLFRHMPPTHSVQEFVQNVPQAIEGAAREIARWFQ